MNDGILHNEVAIIRELAGLRGELAVRASTELGEAQYAFRYTVRIDLPSPRYRSGSWAEEQERGMRELADGIRAGVEASIGRTSLSVLHEAATESNNHLRELLGAIVDAWDSGRGDGYGSIEALGAAVENARKEAMSK